MFQRPDIMRMAQDLASHASARQGEIAKNVANADTPGYRARDVRDFAQVWSADLGADMKTTRSGHAPAFGARPTSETVIDMNAEPSPNGNSVSLEREMMKSSEVRIEHDLALSVYKTSLDMMRSVIGRGR